MSRSSARLSLLVALALGAVACGEAAPRPNIVFLLADDLGWSDVGYHGSEIETPNLDRLAETGVRLEQFYTMQICSPTRAALLTGRHPSRYGLQGFVIRPHSDSGLPPSERTLAEVLHEAGYVTAITGKWHLGHAREEFLPTRRGFDHQYGSYNGSTNYRSHTRDGGLDWFRDDRPLVEEGWITELTGREAARLIREHDVSRPLFLYVPFLAAHTPLMAPPEMKARYASLESGPRRVFAAMVTEMDREIGRIVEALEERGMRKNTLIVFASDNGANEGFGGDNDPLRGGKYMLYEGGIRVPALANWPGVLEAGRVERSPMHVVDWFPTLLGLAGVEPDASPPLDGFDFWPTLAHGAPSPRTEMLLDVSPSWHGLRRGDWKLIVRFESGKDLRRRRRRSRKPLTEMKRRVTAMELYDLAADPGETVNVLPDHPEIGKELSERLRVYAEQAAPQRVSRRGEKDFVTPRVFGPFGDTLEGTPPASEPEGP